MIINLVQFSFFVSGSICSIFCFVCVSAASHFTSFYHQLRRLFGERRGRRADRGHAKYKQKSGEKKVKDKERTLGKKDGRTTVATATTSTNNVSTRKKSAAKERFMYPKVHINFPSHTKLNHRKIEIAGYIREQVSQCAPRTLCITWIYVHHRTSVRARTHTEKGREIGIKSQQTRTKETREAIVATKRIAFQNASEGKKAFNIIKNQPEKHFVWIVLKRSSGCLRTTTTTTTTYDRF